MTAGRARGTVRVMYRDLTIAFRNSRTGSERGAYNRVISYIANAMKIRGTNMTDKSGSMKIGEVKYTREPDDTFLQLYGFHFAAVSVMLSVFE